MDKRIVVGVDLGGTIVRAGVFDAQGKILAIRESPIEPRGDQSSGWEKSKS